MANGATSAALDRDTEAWITSASDGALRALLFAPDRQLLLDAAYRHLIERDGLQAPPVPAISRSEQIVTAIRVADLRFRRDHGGPLSRIADYERYRDKNHDPAMSMIYNEFGSWGYALLAARDDKHISFATQRKQGGSRKQPAFTDQQHERALLIYAEQHAGVIPGKNEYARWAAHRPDMPTAGQIAGRRNGANGREWHEVQALAARRALTERGWDLTRMRLELEVTTR